VPRKVKHSIGPLESLQDAQLWVKNQLANGVQCPCCAQYARIYKRKLHGSMVAALILIYNWFKQHPNATSLHIPSFLAQQGRPFGGQFAGGDVVKLRFWGLIERVVPDQTKRGWVGRYRITPLGRRFVEGKQEVPRYVFLYNQVLLRSSTETTNIRAVLDGKFSYTSLMNG
jgi:hypothetical protein